MSGGPNFDDLIGTEPEGAERDRLRHAHELLVLAGPPPEVPPRLAHAPQLAGDNVRVLRRRAVKRRAMVLVAAAATLAVVFFGGYTVARLGGGTKTVDALALRGTAAMPHARATLEVLPADQAGNWPMTLHVTGLARGSHYEVYLVRHGKPWGSCGTFRVASSTQVLSVSLNAPYRFERGDTWVVTRETPGGGAGTTVLKPVRA